MTDKNLVTLWIHEYFNKAKRQIRPLKSGLDMSALHKTGGKNLQPPYDNIPEELKRKAADSSSKRNADTEKPAKITGAEKSQMRLFFKKKRAGIVLTRDEVKAIKQGRKKLRREMKARGIKSKKEFEITAAGLGLYFDKPRGLLLWIMQHWLAAALLSLLGLLSVLYIFSVVTQVRGLFTINLSSGLFREGFSLSDSIDFKKPTSNLFSTPVEDVPAVSISAIPDNIDSIDGEHNDVYFAYTYYIRNEGESTVGYTWNLNINAESKDVSKGCWVMIFEDGVLKFYAKPNNATGKAEALPPFDDNTRGYINIPVMSLAPQSEQFELIRTVGSTAYYRVIPYPFITDKLIATGEVNGVAPKDVHKYTVVLWIEGDDADTTDELIGGYMGVEMNFRLKTETADDKSGGGGVVSAGRNS